MPRRSGASCWSQRRPPIAGAALIAVALAAPDLAQASPDERRPRRGTEWRAVAGGSALFAIGYGIALAVAASGYGRGAEWLAVPVGGPWIALGYDPDVPAGLVGDGVMQAVGVGVTALALSPGKRALGPAQAILPDVEVERWLSISGRPSGEFSCPRER